MTGLELLDNRKTCVDCTTRQSYVSTASAPAAQHARHTGVAPRLYRSSPPTSDGTLLSLVGPCLLLTRVTYIEIAMTSQPTAFPLVESLYYPESEHLLPTTSDQARLYPASYNSVAIIQTAFESLYLRGATSGSTTATVVAVLLDVRGPPSGGYSVDSTRYAGHTSSATTYSDVTTSTNIPPSDSRSSSESIVSTTSSTFQETTTSISTIDTTTSTTTTSPESSCSWISQSATSSSGLFTAVSSPSVPCSAPTIVPSPSSSDAKSTQSSGLSTTYQASSRATSSSIPTSSQRPSSPTTTHVNSSATLSQLSRTSTLGLPNSSDTEAPFHSSRGTGHHIVPAVAGGVIGGIILLAAVVTLVLCIRRRMRSARRGEFV